MQTLKKSFLVSLILTCFVAKVNAQILILEKDVLDKIKNSNTHIVVSSNNFPDADKYFDVFKKYWTVTQSVDVITTEELPDKLIAGDTYFSLETKILKSDMNSAMFFYLNLWTPRDKALKRNKRFSVYDELSLAHIQISTHGKPHEHLIPQFNLDGNGYTNNWNPGTLKNFLQQLTALLRTGKKFLGNDITDKEQLKLLKGLTIYCPEDDFNTMNAFGKSDKYTDQEISKLFDGCSFSYKILSNEELQDKILEDKEPFYYLLYLRGLEDGKMIAVVNSRTGQLVYSTTERSFSHNIKSGDIKDLSKAINKN
ncbi:MAG: hypothetical protein JST19_14265 [Bacteroidetes bacterium]|nr:hypothetical protein [Bacteroidota bacterium]